MFVRVLIAFTLPFGYSAEACGSRTQPYRGAELLVAHVEADGDEEYAASVAHHGLVLSWLLFDAALYRVLSAVFRCGRLGEGCADTALLALRLGVLRRERLTSER